MKYYKTLFLNLESKETIHINLQWSILEELIQEIDDYLEKEGRLTIRGPHIQEILVLIMEYEVSIKNEWKFISVCQYRLYKHKPGSGCILVSTKTNESNEPI